MTDPGGAQPPESVLHEQIGRCFSLAVAILEDRAAAAELVVRMFREEHASTQGADARQTHRELVAATHRLAAAHRRATKLPDGEHKDQSARWVDGRSPDDAGARVRATIAALPKAERETVLAVYFGARTISQVASERGEPVAVVRRQLWAAVHTLQCALDTTPEDPSRRASG